MLHGTRHRATDGAEQAVAGGLAGYYDSSDEPTTENKTQSRVSAVPLAIALSLACWTVLIGLGWGLLRLTGLAS